MYYFMEIQFAVKLSIFIIIFIKSLKTHNYPYPYLVVLTGKMMLSSYFQQCQYMSDKIAYQFKGYVKTNIFKLKFQQKKPIF